MSLYTVSYVNAPLTPLSKLVCCHQALLLVSSLVSSFLVKCFLFVFFLRLARILLLSDLLCLKLRKKDDLDLVTIGLWMDSVSFDPIPAPALSTTLTSWMSSCSLMKKNTLLAVSILMAMLNLYPSSARQLLFYRQPNVRLSQGNLAQPHKS